jgi:uncharacterized membrane protein YjgN (DUF898 family)
MEQDNQTHESSIFGLTIDLNSKTHLVETARWTRFLAIAGFVFIGLMIVYGIVMSAVMGNAMSKVDNDMGPAFSSAFGVVMIMYMVVIGVIYFFPCLFTLRFSNHLREALNTNDQEKLTKAFQNLKITVRYLGILTIIGLAFFVIAILFAIIAGAFTAF